MTTLFNLFCPIALSWSSINYSVGLFSLFSMAIVTIILLSTSLISSSVLVKGFSSGLFPLSGNFSFFMVQGFLLLSVLNLISLVCYSYPMTTTLGFNLSMALTFWLISILIMSVKFGVASNLLPANSPWYLIPFLSLVEAISLSVRPITLCFRLLANMSAGHILLTLICKMSLGLWLLGSLFGVLELMVSMVQAFVFLMLVSVYLEEAYSH